MAKQTKTLTCDFASVSFGRETARLGIKAKREKMDLLQLDELLTGARLSVEITPLANDGETPPLPGITETGFSGIADCKHLGLGVDAVSAALTFAKKGLSIEALAGLANRTGKVKLTRIGDAEGFSEPDEE